MSLFDMTGQVAIITGSSRGIGKAIAEEMAEQGAKVVISSRKPTPAMRGAADDQPAAWRRNSDCGCRQYLVKGRSPAAGR
jgi:NAD(P)-dependent dehydrogenase (short-subunit alcohol dehydrogenase family)